MKQLVEIAHCPICNATDFKKVMISKDHMITGEEFSIVECSSCGFWFTNPIPSENKIGEYYKSDVYVSHSSSKKGLINSVYNWVRNYTLKKKLKLVQGLCEKGVVVDYGCGTGHFLNILKNAGYDAKGFEPDDDARRFTVKEFGIQTSSLDKFSELPKESVDVITMWHVLEHVYHLKRDFEKIVDRIKPGGYLIIAVPNRMSFDAESYKELWAAYDLPRHLYHFSPSDIKNLSTSFGLELVEIAPMKFDAYYVSMLSEKYKGGSLMRAFINGIKSNRKADENGFSSQIYVLKK